MMFSFCTVLAACCATTVAASSALVLPDGSVTRKEPDFTPPARVGGIVRSEPDEESIAGAASRRLTATEPDTHGSIVRSEPEPAQEDTMSATFRRLTALLPDNSAEPVTYNSVMRSEPEVVQEDTRVMRSVPEPAEEDTMSAAFRRLTALLPDSIAEPVTYNSVMRSEPEVVQEDTRLMRVMRSVPEPAEEDTISAAFRRLTALLPDNSAEPATHNSVMRSEPEAVQEDTRVMRSVPEPAEEDTVSAAFRRLTALLPDSSAEPVAHSSIVRSEPELSKEAVGAAFRRLSGFATPDNIAEGATYVSGRVARSEPESTEGDNSFGAAFRRLAHVDSRSEPDNAANGGSIVRHEPEA